MKRNICTVFVFIMLLTGCAHKGVTGNEWLLKQPEYFDELIQYTENLDEVYSLYISGAISPQDFVIEIQTLNQQYEIIQGLYAQAKKDYPVKPESHSYVSKLGTDGIDKARSTLSEILYYSVDNNGNPLPADEIAYMYLDYRQEIAGYLAEYTTAYQWVNDELKEEEEN